MAEFPHSLLAHAIINSMKVQAIREYPTRGSGQTAHVHEVSNEPCCDAMRDAWQKRAVGFGSYDKTFNINEDVNIYRCKPWPGGTAWDDHAIRFCPFCGTTIEVVVRDAVVTQ